MGKKKATSSGKTYVSKGKVKTLSPSNRRIMKANKTESEKLLNIQKAWMAGYNPWVTYDNPNLNETNKRKIKAKANDLWGSYKEKKKRMFTTS